MTTACPGQSTQTTYTTGEIDGCTILTSEITSITVIVAACTDEDATTDNVPVYKVVFTSNTNPSSYSIDMTVLAPDGVTSISTDTDPVTIVSLLVSGADPNTFDYLTFIDGVTAGSLPAAVYDHGGGEYALYLPALAGTELLSGNVTLEVFN